MATGTVTGRVDHGRHASVGRRIAAMILFAAAVLGVLALAVVGDLRLTPQTLVLLLALGGVMVVARGASIAFRVAGGDDVVGPYEHRRCSFVLTEAFGPRHTCHLDGEPVGEPPRRGDLLDVYGRTGRDGAVRVREAVRADDRAAINTRPAPAAAAAWISDVAAALIILTCVVAGLALLIGGPS